MQRTPPASDPVLQTIDVRRHFDVGHGRTLKAVDGVSLSIASGETLALVGESGSGKTTFGRLVVRLETATAGSVRVENIEMTTATGAALRSAWRRVQMVFQNPMTSLSPRFTVLDTLTEPMKLNTRANAAERRERAAVLLERVALRPELLDRYPHEISGGQRQRVGIARAIALDPALVVADEPTASLDVSTQAQIVNLLLQLQAESQLAYLFITHHLGLAAHVAHNTAVMYLGRIVETGPSEAVFNAPLHPYTVALVSTRREGAPIVLEGIVPSAITPPPGCHFASRCPIATRICHEVYPELAGQGGEHRVACHRAGELTRATNGTGATQ